MSTETATLLLQFEGQPVPAGGLSWFEVAPCGCLVGAAVVQRHDTTITTEAQAWDALHDFDTPAKAEEDRKRGFTVRLGRRSDVHQLKVKCPHDPEWGITRTPVPDGWVWQTPERYARSRDRKHLVPEDAAATTEGGKDDPSHGTSLCGRTGLWFSRDRGALAECQKCVRAAAKAVAR